MKGLVAATQVEAASGKCGRGAGFSHEFVTASLESCEFKRPWNGETKTIPAFKIKLTVTHTQSGIQQKHRLIMNDYYSFF